MKKIVLLVILNIAVFKGMSQTTHDFMLGGGLDLIKTDIVTVFNKIQAGGEVNYFLTRDFALTGGFEIWSADQNSVVVGFRWYPVNNFLTRFRSLIGENDFGLGLGYSHPFSNVLRGEVTGDYYIVDNEFGLRVGVNFILNRGRGE